MNNLNKNLFDSKLMLKLMMYFSIIILIMLGIVIYSIEYTANYNKEVNHSIDTMSKIQDINEYSTSLTKAVENYYNLEYFEDKLKIAKEYQNIKQCIDELYLNDNNYIFRDIDAITETIYNYSLQLIMDLDNNEDSAKFYFQPQLERIKMLQNYLDNYIFSAMNYELLSFRNYSLNSTLQTKNQSLIIYLICSLVTLLCVFFAYSFSRSIAQPIHSLSKSCKKIAKGDLSIRHETKKKNHPDEIDTLIKSFNSMIEIVDNSVTELQNKALIEKKLKEEQINNEKNKSLLKEAELKFLQMQIDPHFLFNILNSISALSQIEGASMTTTMIKNLSNILHYTLNKFDKTVSLAEEIDLIQNYLSIQKMRFQDRLNYNIDIPNNFLTYNIPSMILQPIVENSILHGIEPNVDGGTVEISAKVENDILLIVIKDDGIGMDKETLELLKSNNDEDNHNSTHGIGIVNVKKRLELLYGKNMLNFQSEIQKGTISTIRIPIND